MSRIIENNFRYYVYSQIRKGNKPNRKSGRDKEHKKTCQLSLKNMNEQIKFTEVGNYIKKRDDINSGVTLIGVGNNYIHI